MKKNKTEKFLIIFFIPLFITLLFYFTKDFKFIKSLELMTVDKRTVLAHQNVEPNKDIAVILIDEASLKSMAPIVGRWPWPRALFQELIDFLTASGANSILFDILFTEPQDKRDEGGNLGANDMALAESTMNSGKVVHAFQIVFDTEDEYNKNLLNKDLPYDFIGSFSVGSNILLNVDNLNFKNETFNNFYIPFPELYQTSSGMGVVEFKSDFDGVYRTTNLIRKYKDKYYPVLSLAALMKHPKFKGKNIEVTKDTFKLGDVTAPIKEDSTYFINMQKKFNNYSISGIFATIQALNQGDTSSLIVDPSEFQDKTIFIGASAVGLKDLKQTSTGIAVPGVYLHASVVDNFLSESFIHEANEKIIFAITFGLALVISYLVLFLGNIVPSVLFFFFVILINTFLSFILFEKYYYLTLLVPPTLVLFFVFLLSFIYKTFTEGKDKRFLKAAFGNYISPELIDMMFESGTPPKLGGDVGIRTAYFTDIQGFSSFSEKLSATQLVELLNDYLTAMTNILLSNGGTLDKYEGDAIIAFFGAPLPLEDHATRAVTVAILMQESLLKLRKKWLSEGEKWPKIVHDMRMRIGINSGEIVTGNMGSESRMNYTMMGDSVNLAARLEEAAKQYGIFTQISHFTANLISKEEFELRELDTIRVVGKTEPVTTFEVLGFKNKIDKNLIDLKENFMRGLLLYKQMKWDEAISHFNKSLENEYLRFPELKEKTNPSKIYLKRCTDYKNNPPPANWDGVFTLTEK